MSVDRLLEAAMARDVETVVSLFPVTLALLENKADMFRKNNNQNIMDILVANGDVVTAVFIGCQYPPLISNNLVSAVQVYNNAELSVVLKVVMERNSIKTDSIKEESIKKAD